MRTTEDSGRREPPLKHGNWRRFLEKLADQHPDHPWLRAQQGGQVAPGQVAQVRGAPGKADGQAA